jgi:hypothetical protein
MHAFESVRQEHGQRRGTISFLKSDSRRCAARLIDGLSSPLRHRVDVEAEVQGNRLHRWPADAGCIPHLLLIRLSPRCAGEARPGGVFRSQRKAEQTSRQSVSPSRVADGTALKLHIPLVASSLTKPLQTSEQILAPMPSFRIFTCIR